MVLILNNVLCCHPLHIICMGWFFVIINVKRSIYTALKTALGLCMAILVISQLLLLTGRVTPAGSSNVIEGSHTGRVLIELEGGYQPSHKIKVLVNGIESASLSVEKLELSLMNNSVVEIDGREVDYPFNVMITPLDNGVSCEGDIALVEGNIARLSRVFVVKDN